MTETFNQLDDSESKDAPRRTMRRTSKHKSGEEEFFNMTYLSNLLPHPQSKKLIEIQTMQSFKYQDELFKQVK